MKLDTWQLISSAIEAGGVFEDGACCVRNSSGQLHRDDGPAIIWPDGRQHWYRDGLLHREDGPAIIYPEGGQHWYQNGNIHRDDGPAVIYADGRRFWYYYGKAVPPPP